MADKKQHEYNGSDCLSMVRITGLVYASECEYISERRCSHRQATNTCSSTMFEKTLVRSTRTPVICTKKWDLWSHIFLVRITGLEPARISPQTPQACASAIPPYPHMIYYNIFFLNLLEFLSKNINFFIKNIINYKNL